MSPSGGVFRVRMRRKAGGETTPIAYEKAYTSHVLAADSFNSGVGGKDEDHVAQVQCAIMIDAGLQPSDRILELGAGTGRLLNRLGDYLDPGTWQGLDVVPELVNACRRRIATLELNPQRFRVERWGATQPYRPLRTRYDFLVGFSVFTHMEPEDIAIVLRNLREVAHAETRALSTFLPLEHAYGRANFNNECGIAYGERFHRVRNAAITQSMAECLADLAGWTTVSASWAERIPTVDHDGHLFVNQSWLVLTPTDSSGS